METQNVVFTNKELNLRLAGLLLLPDVKFADYYGMDYLGLATDAAEARALAERL